jgi:hypothetical protein
MIRDNMSLREIRQEGLAALLERLGPAGTLRFLAQYHEGRGDYTLERHKWLDDVSIDDFLAGIERRNSQQEKN